MIDSKTGFTGSCISTGHSRDDGQIVVHYTKLTLPEYQATVNPNAVALTWEELAPLVDAYENTLVTVPVPETSEEWSYALEVFHMSERLTGDLVAWHARRGQECRTWTDQAAITCKRITEALQ